jgi:hypothetical protein
MVKIHPDKRAQEFKEKEIETQIFNDIVLLFGFCNYY